MISAELERHYAAIGVCRTTTFHIAGGIPASLVSTSNRREHFRAKAKRMKELRTAAFRRMAAMIRAGGVVLPVVVRVVRVAPKAHHVLDRDNLENACKPVRDGIADAFRIDDKDPRIGFVCDQVTLPGLPFVTLEVYRP